MNRFCTLRISLLFLAFFSLISLPLTAQRVSLEALDAYIEQARQDWEIPGLAVSIIKNDSLIFAKGYGVKQLGQPGKVDAHTLFAVASNSKAFTATLLGMLVAQGKLNWDDPVIRHRRDFQMFDPYVTREITVRDLLTHRSGLPTFGGDHLWIGNDLSRDEIIRRIRYLEPTAPFRTTFQYQNLMFLVAGELIPAVAGIGWDEAMQQWILGPLGMTESNTTIRALASHPNVAMPHERVGGKIAPVAFDNLDNVAPAAALNANVLDMAQWMRFNLNEGSIDGQQLLDKDIMWEMHSLQMPEPLSRRSADFQDRQFYGYGLGWSLSDYHGRKIISHGGGMSGMISLQTLVPSEKLGIMIMTNFAPNSPTRALAYRIIDSFLGAPERDWSQEYLEWGKQARERSKEREKALQDTRISGTRPSLGLPAYTGTYQDDLSGPATVRLEKGQLYFDYNLRHRGRLEHWHYDTFRVIWDNPIFDMPDKAFLTFYLDEDGNVEKLKVSFYDPLYFYRVN
ncbi:MAG: serine hydrolase [Calditrichae bacterium]|nr:serine hydrolase [Calditrichia bacterium]